MNASPWRNRSFFARTMHKCDQCGKNISHPTSQSDRCKHHFCDRDCYNAYHAEQQTPSPSKRLP